MDELWTAQLERIDESPAPSIPQVPRMSHPGSAEFPTSIQVSLLTRTVIFRSVINRISVAPT